MTSINEIDFQDLCTKIDTLQCVECLGERKHELRKLAKKAGYSSYETMMSNYNSARRNQPKFELNDAIDLLAKSPNKFDWVIAGLLPMGTTVLLYADGGIGKTLFANYIIKAVACGEPWNGFPTTIGKVLLFQTDEPQIVTAQSMRTANFLESLKFGQLLITHDWQFSQIDKLVESAELYKPVLIVIDSLASSNKNATSGEKDTEYANNLYDLRDLAMKVGCTILVLHHENKSGGVRGTTAIKNNVSEVWHLKRDKQLSERQRILDIEKSRCGCSGQIQLELDPDTYTWQYQGDFSSTQDGNSTLPLKARILVLLQEHPGIIYDPEELVSLLNDSKDNIRKTCERLYQKGLVEVEDRQKTTKQGNRLKCKGYFHPALSNSSETLATHNIELSDKLLDKLSDNQNVQQPVHEPVHELVHELKALPNETLQTVGQSEEPKMEQRIAKPTVETLDAALTTKIDNSRTTADYAIAPTNIEQIAKQLAKCQSSDEYNELWNNCPEDKKEFVLGFLCFILDGGRLETLRAELGKCETTAELRQIRSKYSPAEKKVAMSQLLPEKRKCIIPLIKQLTEEPDQNNNQANAA